jgi:hypothetical protein
MRLGLFDGWINRMMRDRIKDHIQRRGWHFNAHQLVRGWRLENHISKILKDPVLSTSMSKITIDLWSDFPCDKLNQNHSYDGLVWGRLIALNMSKVKELRLTNPFKDHITQLQGIAKELIHLKKVTIDLWNFSVFEELCLALDDMPKVNHFQLSFHYHYVSKIDEFQRNIRQAFEILDAHAKVKSILRSIKGMVFFNRQSVPLYEKILASEYALNAWSLDASHCYSSEDKVTAPFPKLSSKNGHFNHLHHIKLDWGWFFHNLSVANVLEWAAIQKQLR